VPYEWTAFLCTAAGISVPSWAKFIAGTGRDPQRETELRELRRRNRASFKERWGEERRLLERGRASLQTEDDSDTPSIFLDWHRGGGNTSV